MTRRGQAGFSLVEIAITVGVLIIITTLAMPSLFRYLRNAEAQADARELAAILTHIRQQAIKENCDMTVSRSTGGFTATRGSATSTCTNPTATLTVTGMTSAGLYKPSNGLSIAGPNTVIFNRLGAANAASTFTLTSTKYSTTMRVIVETTGRIRILQ